MTDPVTTVSLALRPRLYTLDRALRRPSLRGCTLCGLPYPRAPLLIAKQADGFTYERSAIEQWLETHNTSPAGVELESKQLVPNHSLRSLTQDFHV